MPLVLESSSCCDICAEDYNDDADFSPLAIDCGHIFCRTCIGNFTPKNCPVCRKPFSRGRRLHVDLPDNAVNARSAVNARFSLLLKRVALAFDDGSDSDAVIDEASNWLSRQSKASNNLNTYRPLRAALNALCKQQTGLNAADDLATLQAIENSLRMQLDDQRRAMTEVNEKLQMDLKNAREDLQAERDRYLAGIWIEKEASAVVQRELQSNLHDATRNIHALRGENARLRSLVQEFETNRNLKANTPVVVHEVAFDQKFPPAQGTLPPDTSRPFQAARSVVDLSRTAQSLLPSTQQPRSPIMPYGHPSMGSRSMDNIRDRKTKKAKANASATALVTNQKPSQHSETPPKPCDKSKPSTGTGHGGRDTLTGQPHYAFLNSEPQQYRREKATVTPVSNRANKSRRIIKMTSSPLLRKIEDINAQTGKHGPETDGPVQPMRLQKYRAHDVVVIPPWESHTNTLVGSQAPQVGSGGAKGTKKPARHWWPHGWKLFDSGDV